MKGFLSLLLLSGSLFAQELMLTSEDGFKLYGWLDTPTQSTKSAPLVLLAHQFGADHTIWNTLTKRLNKNGYATLSVDLRGHGKSIIKNEKESKIRKELRVAHLKEALIESDKIVSFENIPQDLSAWIESLSENESIDTERLYLFGSSLGAGAMIPLLSEYEAKGVVALSSGRLDALAEQSDMALSISMSKMLFIAAKNDPLGAAKRTLEYTQKSIFSTAIILSGDGHGVVLLPQVEEYIFSFLDKLESH